MASTRPPKPQQGAGDGELVGQARFYLPSFPRLAFRTWKPGELPWGRAVRGRLSGIIHRVARQEGCEGEIEKKKR